MPCALPRCLSSHSLWAPFRPFSQRSLHYRSAACFRPRLSLAFAFGKAPTGRTLVGAAKRPQGLALIGVRFTAVHALVKAHTCGSLAAARLCALRTRFPPVRFPPVPIPQLRGALGFDPALQSAQPSLPFGCLLQAPAPTRFCLRQSVPALRCRALRCRLCARLIPQLRGALGFAQVPTGHTLPYAATGRTLIDAAKCPQGTRFPTLPLGLALIGVRFTTVHALVKAHTFGSLAATRLCALRTRFPPVHSLAVPRPGLRPEPLFHRVSRGEHQSIPIFFDNKGEAATAAAPSLLKSLIL